MPLADPIGFAVNLLLEFCRWAGSARRISNFTDDLADGRCYVTLIKVSAVGVL